MTTVLDNVEWQKQNELWRSPGARRPDVYYIGIGRKAGATYVILADGWEARGKRRQKWIKTDKVETQDINNFGREQAKKLADERGLPSEAVDCIGTARRSQLNLILEEALKQIEDDKAAGEKEKTAENTHMGCREIRNRLPPDRLLVRVPRLTPGEFGRHVRSSIAEDTTLSLETKKQYLTQCRAICSILSARYGLHPDCEKELRAPRGMTGAKSDERPFRPEDIRVMENQMGGPRFLEVLGEWADTVEGLYEIGKALSLQPADVVFLTHDDLDLVQSPVQELRRKTSRRFNARSTTGLMLWIEKRCRRGGVWAAGYLFPELVFGIRVCQKSTAPLETLTPTEKEAIVLNATKRLRDYFNKFLEEVCEIKRAGISFSSLRHYNLPYLKSQGYPLDVAMDYAGHRDANSLSKYFFRATPQELECIAADLERHYNNLKEGKKETVLLTLSDLGSYLKKALWKCAKKILQAVRDSTLEILREQGQVERRQAVRLNALEAKLDALLAYNQQAGKCGAKRVIATGAQILSFAPVVEGLSSQQYMSQLAPPNHSDAMDETQNGSFSI